MFIGGDRLAQNSSKKDKQDDFLRAGIAGASYETVQRYGSALKEHLVGFSGADNETGTRLQKSLKSIQAQGTNDEYAFSIRQQKAGWAAEVKDTATSNAENIIAGKNSRKIKHDDLPNTPANHPLFDHVEVDADGNIIAGSGSQMKFIGASANDPTGAGNAERALKKLQSKDFQKYIDNDVKIEVPKDEYQQMIDRATDEITAVLGGLVAGPALAVLGVVMGAKASKNLDAANANWEKAKEFEEEMKTAADLCNGIRRRSAMFNRFLIRLQTVFDPMIYQMTEIIKERGTDFRNFTEDERKVVASAMSLAGAIKAVLDTPILDEDGNLTKESGLVIESTQKKIESIVA